MKFFLILNLCNLHPFGEICTDIDTKIELKIYYILCSENLLHPNARSYMSVSGHKIFFGHLGESPMRNVKRKMLQRKRK